MTETRFILGKDDVLTPDMPDFYTRELPEGNYVVRVPNLELDCEPEDVSCLHTEVELSRGKVRVHFEGGTVEDFDEHLADVISDTTGWAVYSLGHYEARYRGKHPFEDK